MKIKSDVCLPGVATPTYVLRMTMTLFGVLATVQLAFAQTSPDQLWARTSSAISGQLKASANAARFDEIPNEKALFIPDDYRLFELNGEVLSQLLGTAVEEPAAMESVEATLQSTISLPMPNGAYHTFQLIKSPVLSPALQEKFPKIRAYRGQCLDDPTMSMRLDVSPRGNTLVLRAQVHAPEGTIIVDPFGKGTHHMSFVKNRNQRRRRPPHRCLLERTAPAVEAANRRRGANARIQSGAQLRTYRLAVACTGEYTQFHGGTISGALAAIHTTINRVNEVYERDVAIRFELVDNNDQIIFTNPNTDPFSNHNPNQLLSQNQTTIDAKIGDANYDIGHIFCTADSGIAPGPVGVSGQKAMGVTGQASPFGDPFDIDYVAHEIGHQLNADHTFNGTGCLPGARWEATAVEPGSGSTILAYAGICGADNLQGNSHDYFHSVSIQQIVDYSSSGMGAVGSTQATGNSIPNVDAGDDFSIPKDTPFKLTAMGSDSDNDLLHYCWEQIDRGPAASVNASDDGAIPLFRSFEPRPDPSRVFPQWSDILNGTQSTGEQLPSKQRTMRFQIMVRDGRSGGGGVSTDTSEVNVVESAGPFQVTAPSSNSIDSPLVEVQWDVAHTDQSPIKCSHVNILLSTNGGQSFSKTLSSNTPNDGRELVALPPTAVNNLRILVESVDNIFFAVNPVNFTVKTADTRVFLVRHAEKASSNNDPDLSEPGQDRAKALADLMSQVGTTHVYSTDSRRTRQTSQPTLDSTGISLQVYDSNSEVVTRLNALPPSSRALVVGHNNTVGPIANALGVSETISVGNEFDNLFVVGLRSGQPLFVKHKYQAAPYGSRCKNQPAESLADQSSGSTVVQPNGRTRRANTPTRNRQPQENPAELWVEPQDSVEAINNPDLYAWKLFVALNWPADMAKRQADPNRVFGENATTVWESWKFSSGENDEVFLDDGSDPGPWLAEDDEPEPLRRNANDFDVLPLQQQQLPFHGSDQEFDPSTSAATLNENHMNKDAFEFVRQKELYNIEGQEALFSAAKEIFKNAAAENRVVAPFEYKLHFPVGAKEVKAQWRKITEDKKDRYYWAEFEDANGSQLVFGLTSLHITTKDIPNWFWATFEHVDNPMLEGAEAWHFPSVDSSAGDQGFPSGLGIEGTRWANYRLRGTQVDFVDSFGDPTILANSQIEAGFQQTSSCITCHARAAIGPRIGEENRANRLSIFKKILFSTNSRAIPIGNVGNLPEELFVRRTSLQPIAGDLQYLQVDFVWSLMRAQRKAPNTSGPDEVSFARHIRPLFRQLDIDAMRSAFDLTNHEDVSEHADAIYQRLDSGTMPCDAPWPRSDVQLFKKWMDEGKRE